MPADCHPLCTRRHHWGCRLKQWALGPCPRVWLLAVILFSVAGAILTFALYGATVHHNCRAVEGVKAVIRQVSATEIKMIGQPGTPGYVYYLTHPEELAAAKADLLRQQNQFAARRCALPLIG